MIESYLDKVLTPWLREKPLTPGDISLIVADVQSRLRSALEHWSDPLFRDTLLSAAAEEALFYQPRRAPLEIRALVVLCVRNSLVEDWCSDLVERAVLLSDQAVVELTQGAIRHFAAWREVWPTAPLRAGDQDVFGLLPVHYPAAWRAFEMLAALDEATLAMQYAPLPPRRPDIPRQPLLSRRPRTVVLSGASPVIDPTLGGILAGIQDRRVGFFTVDSFKRLTRNSDKLLKVVEFVFACQKPFVTLNYYLSNGYVARRRRLWQPAHRGADLERRLGRSDVLRDVTPRQREALESFIAAARST